VSKYDRLVDVVARDGERGGGLLRRVDSTFLARAARTAVGERAILVTADSETYPAAELAEARRLAEILGMRHLVVAYSQLENPDYARKPLRIAVSSAGRAVHDLEPIARREGARFLIYGANVDDWGTPPRHASASNAECAPPLIEAGLTKAEIRELSRSRLPDVGQAVVGLPLLALQYGDHITKEKLQPGRRREELLRSLGFRQFRVRHHDRLARLEIPLDEIARLWKTGATRRS